MKPGPNTGDNQPHDDRHVPVMLREVLQYLAPAPGEIVIDATFGAGGYSRAILAKGATVLGIDRDPEAITAGLEISAQHGKKLRLVEGRFSELDLIAGEAGYQRVHGVVLDIGVSSMQLDQAQRGFSFRSDGPLDMRMGQSGLTAADLVNQLERVNLTRIIGILGEEHHASRISRAIVERRQKMPFSTTSDLAKVVEQAGSGRNDRIHPATRTFQALRIFLNRELEELAQALTASEKILAQGGRLVVVSFHSLEDRIVKRFLADRCFDQKGSRHLPPVAGSEPVFTMLKRGAAKPAGDEILRNPRARSAKLRAAMRTAAPARPVEWSVFGLADFSGVTELSRSSAS